MSNPGKVKFKPIKGAPVPYDSELLGLGGKAKAVCQFLSTLEECNDRLVELGMNDRMVRFESIRELSEGKVFILQYHRGNRDTARGIFLPKFDTGEFRQFISDPWEGGE